MCVKIYKNDYCGVWLALVGLDGINRANSIGVSFPRNPTFLKPLRDRKALGYAVGSTQPTRTRFLAPELWGYLTISIRRIAV